MSLSPAERKLRAQLGAHVLHSKRDGVELTQKARQTFLASFEVLVDPRGLLEPEERLRRAAHARQAHMLRLSLLASRARARRRAETSP